jgi:competence protein ComEA
VTGVTDRAHSAPYRGPVSIRDRLDTLSRAELTGLAIVVVATLAGAGLWYARSLPKPVEIAAAAPPVPASPAAAAGSTSPDPSVAPVGPIVVDVAGHVRRPGVYEFEMGDRVIDAIKRAGGATAKGDLPTLNLAAPLVDGSQVYVPARGEAAPGAATPGGAGASGGELVNVNTADATALETLPGIGEVLAAAIVQYRTENGPFGSVDELESVSGIGPATLEDLRPFVTV